MRLRRQRPQLSRPAPGVQGHVGEAWSMGGDLVVAGRNETDAERVDRNWNELLQELRVAQTGVQILSGFRLTLPFQQRFTALSQLYKVVFLIALVLATIANRAACRSG